MTNRHPLLILLLPLALAGCPESADIATADMHAEFYASVVKDREVEVRAELFEGADSSFSLELTGGDQLVASADGGTPVTLDGDTTYRGELPNLTDELRIELIRESGDNGFLQHAMPAFVDLDSTTFSVADDPVTVSWSNPIDDGSVAIFVDSCADIAIETPEQKEPSDDTGTLTLSRAEIEEEAGAGATCAQLVIVRAVTHRMATGFAATSSLRTERTERIEVQLTP